jgi:glyoxalase family protein
MENRILGLHHITAIAGNAQRNFNFYTKVLGLRFLKKTVNFDDPGTYHFYFGDENGSAGTILTFFPWEHMTPGRRGPRNRLRGAHRQPRFLDEALRCPRHYL